jgi:proton-translocating NADH-quinone oxidoreductase chain M
LLIGIVGYNKRKIHASFLLFFYTFIGSLLMLLGIINLYIEIGSFQNIFFFYNKSTLSSSSYLWWCFFFSFAIKIPVFPFHLWLPEAHVESPTEGSVILAGILLKLGTYGICRFLFFLFPYLSYYYSSLVIVLCSLGIIYTSFMALRQIDLKKIIAYSSVGHMNFCTIGLFSFNLYSLHGSIFMMIGHGVISSALFFLIGMIYQRYHTKLLYHYSGISYSMPFYYFFFFFFMFSNISFPMTVNFISEFLILIGIFLSKFYIPFIFCLFGLFLGVLYNLYMFNKIFFGLPKKFSTFFNIDLSIEEFILCIFLFFFNLLLGIYPSIFLNWL